LVSKRSITDEEIALIKAMRSRGMKSKDIQFYFNRPERAVNSGRIADIAAGKYSNSSEIEAASATVLDAFFADTSVRTQLPQSNAALESKDVLDPTSQQVVQSLFEVADDGQWYLTSGETDQVECKTSFGFKHSAVWLKAIAALANNRGGYVLFGVEDKDPDSALNRNRVVGLQTNEFANADPAEITNRLRSVFDPTPRIEIASHEIGASRIGVIYVEQHPSRPVIASKSESSRIAEGDIFFRYPGQSARIKYSDLRSLLDARDMQARQSILPMVERLLELGPNKAVVADLENGILDSGTKQILIDPELVKQINFIREGDFAQTHGAPTLKLVGNVHVASQSEIGERGVLTDENVIVNFLEGQALFAPKEYVRFAVAGSARHWLPIFYFAKLVGLNGQELVSFVQGIETSKLQRKLDIIQRVNGERSAFANVSGTPATYLKQLLAGEFPAINSWQVARSVAHAFRALPNQCQIPRERLLKLLAECRAVLLAENHHEVLTDVYRAAARLDELFDRI
jgi:hypothetical protein